MQRHYPRIGITCDFEAIVDRRGSPSPRYLLPEDYVTAVVRAGGEPWLLPHLLPEQAQSVLAMLDGLVVSGGDFDVPPAYYGEEARHVHGIREMRSAFERALVLGARQHRVPLLGICGGLQIINVALGGSLYQDISEKPGSLEHQQPCNKRLPHHSVTITPGTLLARLVGATALDVNSTHHQMVRDVGRGLRASAVAPDGVIEAVEADDDDGRGDSGFLLGVQWHPEAITDSAQHQAIYEGLVNAAAAKKLLGKSNGAPGALQGTR